MSVAKLAVAIAACLTVVGCRDAPVPDPKPPAQAPSLADDLALEIETLVDFRGEAHAVVALPDGEAIVALSWFVRTDFGAGEMRSAEGGRQAYIVRYGQAGEVRWSTHVEPWPAGLAFDGDHTVVVVGETRAATTHVVIDTASGAIVRSGFVDGYPKAVTIAYGHALVLSAAKGSAGAVIDDVSGEPVRWPWRAAISVPLAMAASPGGGVVVLAGDVDASERLTAIAIDRSGTELWRRPLCAKSFWGSVFVEADGSTMVVACEPAQIIRLAPDGAVRSEIALGDAVRPETIAHVDGKLVIGGQLLGELVVGGRTFASWDAVEGAEKSGHGDAIALVHDGKTIVGVVHGHGREADQTKGVAAAAGAIWMVGDARDSLDFGGGKLAAPDPDGVGIGFVVRLRAK